MLFRLVQEFFANYEFKFKQRGLLPNAKMSLKTNTQGIARKIRAIAKDRKKVTGQPIPLEEAWKYITDLVRMQQVAHNKAEICETMEHLKKQWGYQGMLTITPRFWDFNTNQPNPKNDLVVVFNWWGHKMIEFQIKLCEPSPYYYDETFVRQCGIFTKDRNLGGLYEAI